MHVQCEQHIPSKTSRAVPTTANQNKHHSMSAQVEEKTRACMFFRMTLIADSTTAELACCTQDSTAQHQSLWVEQA